MNIDLKRRIEDIKDHVSIEVLINMAGGHVQSGWGDWQKTLCPFHDDNNPSASTNLMAGAFTCHACGIRGDVIAVAQMYLEMTGQDDSFKGTLTWLEENF